MMLIQEEWFFHFFWDGSEEKAQLMSSKSNLFVKFRWLDDSDDQDKCFFEIRILVDEITKDVSLIVTDFAYDDEVEESKMLWDNQISDLKKNSWFFLAVHGQL